MNFISLYPNFSNHGGAQNVLLQVAEFLNNNHELPLIFTDTPIEQIDCSYIGKAVFKKFSIFEILRISSKDTIFISHDRRYTTILTLLKKIFNSKIQILHIAHNVFLNKRKFTLLPQDIVAVSQTVKRNLMEYFRIPETNISVIYNGIKDISSNHEVKEHKNDKIRIILLGRIEKVKRQLEIVHNLKGRLNNNIEISFAGTGSEELLLREKIKGDSHFKFIGQVNVNNTLPNYDYVLLFSEKEGLPLSLIEGCKHSKPLITNNLSSALEINNEGENGFVFKSFEALINGLNNLPSRDSSKYLQMAKASREIFLKNFIESKMLLQYKQILEKFG